MDDLEFCIEYLKKVNGIKEEINLPKEETFRALMNISMPIDFSEEYYAHQDAALKTILAKKQVQDSKEIQSMVGKICLWQGDITCLKVDAIVNACNEKLLGCFVPLHSCVDNAIHSAAGLEVRRDLLEVMQKQGNDEPNGRAKITSGYNLPSKFILHTVGPKVEGRVSNQDRIDLRNCYLSCLELAEEKGCQSIAFPSISTGLYGFPIKEASKIAIDVVPFYLQSKSKSIEKVIFVAYSLADYEIYHRELSKHN